MPTAVKPFPGFPIETASKLTGVPEGSIRSLQETGVYVPSTPERDEMEETYYHLSDLVALRCAMDLLHEWVPESLVKAIAHELGSHQLRDPLPAYRTLVAPRARRDNLNGHAHYYSISPEQMREDVSRHLGEDARNLVVYPLVASIDALTEFVDAELARLGIPESERSPWL